MYLHYATSDKRTKKNVNVYVSRSLQWQNTVVKGHTVTSIFHFLHNSGTIRDTYVFYIHIHINKVTVEKRERKESPHKQRMVKEA